MQLRSNRWGRSQKSEDNLAITESELEKHTILVTDLTRKIDELQIKADEAVRLKDQVDECGIFFLYATRVMTSFSLLKI